MFNERLANTIFNNSPFDNVEEVQKVLEEVFQHILVKEYSVFWKFPISKKVISEYIENYPAKIRVLDYKNGEVFRKI